MNAVNYKTSKYITLAVKPYDVSDYTSDEEFMREVYHGVRTFGGTVNERVNNYISFLYEADYENANSELKKLDTQYFDVSIQSGYHEGFSIDIEPKFQDGFNSWKEKCDAQKDVTEIEKFLIYCANIGLVACYPGCRTTYLSYEETIRGIDDAVNEMKSDIKNIDVA